MDKEFAKEPSYQSMKECALRLLARRDHSKLELKTKLAQRRKLNAEQFDILISQLQQLGYLADELDLAKRWIAQWRTEGRGRNWIDGKLRSKGLPRIDLHDDLAERKALVYFFERKWRGKKIRDLTLEEKIQVARSLRARGFSSFLIEECLRARLSEEDDYEPDG